MVTSPVMDAALQLPDPMTLEEFLVWDAPEGAFWQLVDGEPCAMAPASPAHGVIQGEVGSLLRNHLTEAGGRCRMVVNPGVKLGVRSDRNYRIPDLAVTCTPLIPGEPMLTDPVVLVEILSPSNQAETWTNVWATTTIPSVQEILVVRTAAIGAQLLRRNPDGTWPDLPQGIEDGDVALDSIGFRAPLAALYAGTWLA
jgi:Uma2 family endonuclease